MRFVLDGIGSDDPRLGKPFVSYSGGETTYSATIDYEQLPVWHYNHPGETAPAKAIDPGYFEALGPEHPRWPEGGAWPDYFMIGQPHNNFYEGTVYYDDIRLEEL